MTLKDCEGKTVMLNLKDEFVKGNRTLLGGEEHHLVYAKVVKINDYEIWVENNQFKLETNGKEENHTIHFSIPFTEIVSIACFPNREFPEDRDISDNHAKTIGFR